MVGIRRIVTSGKRPPKVKPPRRLVVNGSRGRCGSTNQGYRCTQPARHAGKHRNGVYYWK